jgi:hypothetical protein
MPQEEVFELFVTRKEGAVEPVIEARYRGERAFSIPKKIPGIENTISKLQTDILRDSGARREVGLQEPEQAASTINGRLEDDTDLTSSGASVKQIGTLLFAYLFQGEIQALYRKAVGNNEEAESSLRINLVFPSDDAANPLSSAPWLNVTPWETVWDNVARQFLATAGSTFFSRSVGETIKIRPRPLPLRILVMVAAPHHYQGQELPELKGPEEVHKIRDALPQDTCQVSCVPGESFDDLEQHLYQNDANRHYDVFHFIGHGDFDPDRGEGFLLFKEPDGAGGARVYADQLRELLSDPWAPQLVVLNSCSGAKGRRGDMFSSTAALLNLGGIPAVVAMQFPITDRCALAFSRSFYRWLGAGATVQDATRRARRSLKGLGSEWITPVLYLRIPDGRLIHTDA